MSPRTLAAIAIFAALAWHDRPHSRVSVGEPVMVEERSVAASSSPDFASPCFADRPLAGLAKAGACTVVEVYINTRATCKRIERQPPALRAQRGDVVVRCVPFPERGPSWSPGDTLTREPRLDGHALCGTPHVETCTPDGTVLARDERGQQDGLEFLQAWLAQTVAAG